MCIIRSTQILERFCRVLLTKIRVEDVKSDGAFWSIKDVHQIRERMNKLVHGAAARAWELSLE